ncbi:hypothetical protein ACKKBF_B40070 [Auxenochlorella protothecoides x Auxenochlorella symbiontica]
MSGCVAFKHQPCSGVNAQSRAGTPHGMAWIVGEAAPSRLLEGQPAPLLPGGPYLDRVSHMPGAVPMCWLIGSATAGAGVAGGHGY